VPEVADRCGVNANLLSEWRRLGRPGLLNDERSARQSAMLPVKVSTPTVLPTERVWARKTVERDSGVHIEVEFVGGQRLRFNLPIGSC
jgi:transposase-like protein